MTALTPNQLTTDIANAIRAHDFPAVADMLRALAVVDPRRAGAVYETITAARDSAPTEADRQEVAPALRRARCTCPDDCECEH
jgi:hypothetical protein